MCAKRYSDATYCGEKYSNAKIYGEKHCDAKEFVGNIWFGSSFHCLTFLCIRITNLTSPLDFSLPKRNIFVHLPPDPTQVFSSCFSKTLPTFLSLDGTVI